jgi:hypothetical protein
MTTLPIKRFVIPLAHAARCAELESGRVPGGSAGTPTGTTNPTICTGRQRPKRPVRFVIETMVNLTEGRKETKNLMEFWSEWQDSNLHPE